MQTQLIPFGKYKGQPVEVLTQDKDYLTWLQAQSWFRDKFASFNTFIINNFTETSETPEHNAMQAQFTDECFCCEFLGVLEAKEVINKEYKYRSSNEPNWLMLQSDNVSFKFTRACFEVKGVDVVMHFDAYYNAAKWSQEEIGIEIKPALSDDYPGVLRQMNQSRAEVLYVGGYCGKGATLEQVQKIFTSSGKAIVQDHEIPLRTRLAL